MMQTNVRRDNVGDLAAAKRKKERQILESQSGAAAVQIPSKLVSRHHGFKAMTRSSMERRRQPSQSSHRFGGRRAHGVWDCKSKLNVYKFHRNRISPD